MVRFLIFGHTATWRVKRRIKQCSLPVRRCGLVGHGGRLTLTPDALIFKPNAALAFSMKTLTIPLEQCVSVATYNLFGFSPVALRMERSGSIPLRLLTAVNTAHSVAMVLVQTACMPLRPSKSMGQCVAVPKIRYMIPSLPSLPLARRLAGMMLRNN